MPLYSQKYVFDVRHFNKLMITNIIFYIYLNTYLYKQCD